MTDTVDEPDKLLGEVQDEIIAEMADSIQWHGSYLPVRGKDNSNPGKPEYDPV